MNDLSTYFGVNTAVVTPFAYENALNTLITNLDLFDVQYHTENSILSYRPDRSVCAGSWGNLALRSKRLERL